jgi:hypothetical protein
MTLEEWQVCDDAAPMLMFLRDVVLAPDRAQRKPLIPRDTGRVGDRQVRLFAAACCRQLWPILTDQRSRAGIEGVESCGEDLVAALAMQALHGAAGEAVGVDVVLSDDFDDLGAAAQTWLDTGADRGGAARWRATLASQYAAHAAYCAAATALYACKAWRGEVRDWSERISFRANSWTCGEKTAQSAAVAATAWSENVDAALVAGWVLGHRGEAEKRFLAARRSAKAIQANLLRDIAGSPFRPPPVIAPAVLANNGGVALRMAEVIYEGQCFNELPVLADLLEKAGSTETDLLGHLRGPGPHTLGCWALDLVLAKESTQRTKRWGSCR